MKVNRIAIIKPIDDQLAISDYLDMAIINSYQELTGTLREKGWKLVSTGTNGKMATRFRKSETTSTWTNDFSKLKIWNGSNGTILNFENIEVFCQFDKSLGSEIELNKQLIIGNGNIIGDGNKQEISTPSNDNKDSKTQPEKPGIFKLITDPSTLAALGGFFSVEIGTYFYPISYNHLIGVFIAVVILIIGIFKKHQKTKNV